MNRTATQIAAAEKAFGEKLKRAIGALMAVGATPTRHTIAEESGVRLSAIDYHLKKLRDLGEIHSPTKSVWNLSIRDDQDRAVSGTFLPSGGYKLEIGEVCIDLSMREARLVAMVTGGVALAFGK